MMSRGPPPKRPVLEPIVPQGVPLKRYNKNVAPPKKQIYWHRINIGLDILLAPYCGSRLKVIYDKIDKKKIATMCTCAPIYARLRSNDRWRPHELRTIKRYGLELYNKTKALLKLKRGTEVTPYCVYPTFLMDDRSINAFIGDACLEGDITIIQGLHTLLEKLITETYAILFTCGGKTFSFWKMADQFFCYCPLLYGNGNFNDVSFILRSKNLVAILTYLFNYVDLENNNFKVYCLKILSIKKIPVELQQIKKPVKRPEKKLNVVQMMLKIDTPPPEADEIYEIQKPKIEKALIENEKSGLELKFDSDWNNTLYNNRGFLVGTSFCEKPELLLHTNIACAIFLYHVRTMIWTRTTLNDIMLFGGALFRKSERRRLTKHVLWTERLLQPVNFGSKNFQIIFEKFCFGDVTTEEKHIFGIKHAVLAFFKQNDLGIIWGPQVQLIWAESGLFFTFNAKERDAVGRKWTRLLSSRLKSYQDPDYGAACVSWFKTPQLLAEQYIANIQLKHRKDPYRICKLHIIEIPEKSDNEEGWIAVGINKWRIIAFKSLCDFVKDSEKELQLFAIKGFCIGIACSLYTHVEKTEDWQPKSVDSILELGHEYLMQSVELKPHLTNFSTFEWKDLKKTFVLTEKRYQILIIPCTISGSVFYKTKSGVEMSEGIRMFFEDYRNGLICIRSLAIPVWADEVYFYFLYPYDKLLGKNENCFCNCQNIYSKTHGHAFVMRFKNLPDMFDEILYVLNLEDQDQYCIYSIEGKDRPPLMHFSPFGDMGAIIRPFDSLHEGHPIFNVRADQQTYANLLICLCFASLTKPLEWSKDDLLEILKMGDAIHCRLVSGLQQCQEKYYFNKQPSTEVRLQQIVPQIGENKFTFTQDPKPAIFNYIPPPEEEEVEQELETEKEDASGDGEDEVEEESTQDIRMVLEPWELAEDGYAILDSKLFIISLWKKDLVYFVFDPKACEPDGKLNKKRMKDAVKLLEGDNAYGDDPTELPNDGSAYVAYFYDYESFIDHIVSRVPEEYYSEPVALNIIRIKMLPVPLSELEGKQLKNLDPTSFLPLKTAHFIIRASLSQDELMFLHQNKQEAAMCFVSLAFAISTPPNKWNVDLLDTMLKYGDRLYVKTIEYLRQNNPARVCEEDKLKVHELLHNIMIYKVKFLYKVFQRFRNCLTQQDMKELKKFLIALKAAEFGSGAIFLAKGITNAIWKNGSIYYLFDPQKTNPYGQVCQQGSASLNRFDKLDVLIEFLTSKVLCLPGNNTYQFIAYDITKTLPPNLPELILDKINFATQLPSNQISFVSVGNNMKVLQKTLEPGEFELTKDFASLAALLNSNLEYVTFWSFGVFKKINVLGLYLEKKLSCLRLDEYEDEEKHLEEINYSIKIDNVICKIVVNSYSAGAPTSELNSPNLYLRQDLQRFFQERKSCIVTGGADKSYALWVDGSLYYMFWINNSVNKVMVQETADWKNLAKIILNEAEPDMPSNGYQIKYVQISKLNLCEVDTKDEKAALLAGKDRLAIHLEKSCPRKPDPLEEICRECYYNKFEKQTERRNKLVAKIKQNYIPFQKGVEMLISCDILRSHKFYGTESYMPSIKATCIIAAGMAYIKNPLIWNKKTITKILKTGNELFMNTVAVKRTNILDITDMEQTFHLYNFSLQIVALPPTQELAEQENLVTVLSYILRKHKTAYFAAPNNFVLTFIMAEKNCYVFYPGSIEKFCEDPSTESACLLRFDSIARAVEFLLKNKKIDSECLEIGPIVVMGRH